MFVNDLHYTRRPPECRAPTYPEEILDKLHEVARHAVKFGATGIGCSGDWFHRKGKVTFAEANDLLAILTGWKQRGIDVFGILGNHDIAGHSLKSLHNRAVGSLVHSKALHLLDHGPWSVRDDAGGIYVTGTSYFHGCDHDDDSRLKMYGAERPDDGEWVHVHVAHGTLLQGGTFFEEYTLAKGLIDLLWENDVLPDVLVCGHLHFSQGVKLYEHPDPDSQGKVAVCALGSLGRVSRDDFDRRPEALLLATHGPAFMCKAIPVGKDVETPEAREGHDPEEHEARIQEFVRVLREEADTWSTVDHTTLLGRLVEEMGYDEEVLRTALDAVEKRQ